MDYPTTYDSDTASSSKQYPFLRFDAFSMLDLLRAKLSEQKGLTDYIYSGSNLSIFLDIVSNMYEALMFNLNQAASESMMSDTRLYSNINRLTKFLGYSPSGYKAATVIVNAIAKSPNNAKSFMIAPKYSTITLDAKDGFGDTIKFSTVDYSYINANTTTEIILCNGGWKYYPTTFTATGEVFEKFILNSINTEGEQSEYVAYPYIDVYVKRPLGNSTYKTIYFSAVTDGMFMAANGDSVLTPTDNKFSIRLNENKKYEIEFGDGIHGAKLKQGDIVNVVYLQSNGPDGEINVGDIDNRMFEVTISGISNGVTGTKTLTMEDVLESVPGEDNTICDEDNASIIGEYIDDSDSSYDTSGGKVFFYGCTNTKASSTPTKPETVDEIRENAPNWFKRIGRTITTDDYTSYIKENFYSDIVDVVVMNNFKYMSTFYRWLSRIGSEKFGNPRKWLNPSLKSYGTYGYKFADAADSNNVYIWLKQDVESTSVGKSIITKLQDIKPLTAEPVVVSAIDERFAICAGYPEEKNADGTTMTMRDFYNINGNDKNKQFSFNDNGQNRLEVELSSGINISSSIIKNRIVSIIKNFFSTDTMNIGQHVVIGDLQAQILGIDGVKRIRTIFRRLNSDGTYSSTDVIIRNGISLAVWNESIVNGFDIDCTNANVKLEDFQYPVFNDFSAVYNQIDVVVNGSSSLSGEEEY